MSNKIVTIKVDQNRYDEIKLFYSEFITSNNPGEYVDYIANKDGTIITGFLSKKSNKTISFVGPDSLSEAQQWDLAAKEVVKKESKESKFWVDLEEQIGSDEVGVGDLFLPMIVVASYVTAKQIKELQQLGVKDSKKLTDDDIRKLGPTIVKKYKFSKLTLSNEKYNEMIAKGENINSLKAKMHNRALANLSKEYPDVIKIYVDQFVNSDTYYKYFDEKDEPIVRGISFKAKGETYFPSVALSSVIARYAFLLEKDKLDKKYGMDFPFGAGTACDKFLVKIKEKLPKEAIDKLVKINFRNYQ